MKKITKQFLIAFLFFLMFASILSFITLPAERPAAVNVTTLLAQIDEEKIESITVRENQLDITLVGGAKQVLEKESSESLSTLLKNYNVNPDKLKKIAIDVKSESGVKFWAVAILPFLIPFLFIFGFFWFMMRQAQGANNKAMSFGQSRAREFNPNKKLKITFNDVAGVKEAKKELVEVVDFLKNPKKFLALGAKIPKGVLLLGAPGTGKTLLAKAVAGEANVPFFSISGSEFVEMFVGVGASRVRDLFNKAKKNAPCIVFIDEIDAVGRQRGAGLGGSHDEREQTLNQILVEMDGFDPRTNVIIMAATNRPDVLDSALLRPGRFDRRVTLDMPDINDREEILKVHSKEKPLAKNISLRKVAERTPGFSGADLSNLLNEAAILAALENKKEVSEYHILHSIDKVLLGPERRSYILNEKEKEITAYHEAGHALVAHELPHTDPVSKISIVARGSAAGFTLKLPTEDRRLHSRSEFLEDLAVMLAGQVAERIVFNEVTTGAQSDLRQATTLAKKLITEYGMSEKMGLRTFGEREELIFLGKEIHEQRDYSEKTAEEIDKEIHRLTDEAAVLAEKIIKEKRRYLDKIVIALKAKETIETDEFNALFADKE
ncbi:MAG: cell division protein FtsH [Candidatus Buchananbacteria bacterium RIFCSPHIGHO2_02_FULL_40_13]|uniref:ATP-dependent zinc metalloprotease FtsH n=1 Tax=Candidatus Buchananbacteria bacterium RIFCSPLOWO2_01_FULL_39_33 TaxID=1797543 RepID=A0A1G1YKA6_9BACT|nr:MAG: cell division protein FtsH [Candidatus Buchananbacteria bacterium RIFCSPHIGHO2_01_FULL_40_35]OGY50054.1 MAG: cell division protein FtsH [Candidatus Buchananbacteria bacterium RIFCSPHIGHO2_02_FULL_40_13]OGY52711.1 MAG: cell division protein FtsH [Candidatus Buchananbacteria bacterium RIFCSPLOWO2_01_FULL_39_33]